MSLPLPTKSDLLDPENIELALLRQPPALWQKESDEGIIRRDDDTYITSDPFFNEMEDALASGEDIHGILAKLQSSSS
jgi:hypothetical protein